MKYAVSSALLKQGFKYLYKDPEKNLLNLAKWAERFTADSTSEKQLQAFREAAEIPVWQTTGSSCVFSMSWNRISSKRSSEISS
ncbi:MAG: hypothetical protein U5N26_09430 [Candidatus Marinimicrobia bacterium]|nr:hypothetical protein [Candidatus Neomarinimicrobiota bacterium]